MAGRICPGNMKRMPMKSNSNCSVVRTGRKAVSYTHLELEPRYNLNRFVHQRADVFTPFNVRKGEVNMTLEMEYVDYAVAYSRGNLPGIDAEAVRELMNTTGRYGVVDNMIVGANGWTTNWKCLHEPFFAQIGICLLYTSSAFVADDLYARTTTASG